MAPNSTHASATQKPVPLVPPMTKTRLPSSLLVYLGAMTSYFWRITIRYSSRRDAAKCSSLVSTGGSIALGMPGAGGDSA
jgi:hypothetical protein